MLTLLGVDGKQGFHRAFLWGGRGRAGRNPYKLLILPVYECSYGSLQNSGPYNGTALKVVLILGMDQDLFKNLGRNRWCLAHAPAPVRKKLILFRKIIAVY
jgi:hypothetical protein